MNNIFIAYVVGFATGFIFCMMVVIGLVKTIFRKITGIWKKQIE
jgi:hypothetical protein